MPAVSEIPAPMECHASRMVIACRRCNAPTEVPVVRVGDFAAPASAYCDKCHPIALAEFHEEEARRARANRVRLWDDEVGRDAFRDTNRDLIPYPAAFDRVMSWKYGPKGLIVHGTSGQGKSRMLWALLRRLYVDDGRPVHFVRASRFGRLAGDFDKAEAYVRELSEVHILAMDDIGKETATSQVEGCLLEVLDRRTIAGRPTLLTTQFVGDELQARFRDMNTGEAVIRRIREHCLSVSANKPPPKPAK